MGKAKLTKVQQELLERLKAFGRPYTRTVTREKDRKPTRKNPAERRLAGYWKEEEIWRNGLERYREEHSHPSVHEQVLRALVEKGYLEYEHTGGGTWILSVGESFIQNWKVKESI